nr:nuclease A inhibitor family protein [Hymenobacter sp. ISL-91]
MPTDPRDTKGGRETVEASEPDAFRAPTPGGEAQNDEAPQPLRDLTKGLSFMSESEAPLTAVSFAAPAGGLTDAALAELADVPAGTPVERQELTYFLRNHTADEGLSGSAEMANRFKQLQMFMKQELSGTQVYRFGQGPQVPVLVLGAGEGGRLQGFKTVLTET